MANKNYLLLENNVAVNFIVVEENNLIELFDSQKLVEYNGDWGVGWKWDGEKCIDPNPVK